MNYSFVAVVHDKLREMFVHPPYIGGWNGNKINQIFARITK